MVDVQLSEHFWLSEFLVSDTAARMGRVVEPTQDVIDNLTRLCKDILQPLRWDLGVPIVVTSGYRPTWLNSAVRGSSRRSAHTWGGAADLRTLANRVTPIDVCRRIVTLFLPFDQCIHEYPPRGWCHVGIAPRGKEPRKELLTARPGKDGTIYERGINP